MLTALSGFARPLAFASQCAGWLSGVRRLNTAARRSNSHAFGLESTLPAPKSTVSGQTRSNLLPESFMPKTKHQRIPDKKNRIFRTITCFSFRMITTLLPQQKTHKKHVFPPVLAVPRLAGGSGDSAAALGAGRFLAHALSLARRSWCKELKKESNVPT